MLEVVMVFVGSLPVILLFALIALYCRKLLKNIQKKEKLALAMMFVHPSVPKSLRVLSIAFFIFSLGFIYKTITDILSIPRPPFTTSIIIWIGLAAFVHFFRRVYEVTKG